MIRRLTRHVDRARRWDEALLGRQVPDQRPFSEQLRRPRPAVWSLRGRAAYGAILLGMFAAIAWLPEAMGVIAIVILVAAAFFVVAADERRGGRQHSVQSSPDEGGSATLHRGDPEPPAP